MEIRFIFDKIEPFKKTSELKSKFEFDDRNGLNYIMIGEHRSEIEDENRLIHQIERSLNIDLSLLDYWNEKVYDNELNIEDVMNVIEKLKRELENSPKFYEIINYGFDIQERYLKKQFLNDMNYLIERFKMNMENGSKKIKYEIE